LRIIGFILCSALIYLFVFGQRSANFVIGRRLFLCVYGTTVLVCPFGGLFLFFREADMEDKRIAVTAIVIDEQEAVPEVNNVLHEYNDIIIGRMGIPYKERGISLISVALDASPDEISSLTGRLGQISGVSVKAAISKK
jgi:putative iron-only hydrogenase system regulator